MDVLKSHGLGNDYLIVDIPPSPPSLLQVVLLCDRNHGVGGDGVLSPGPRADADYGLRIFNPDGSEAEISGNGLRIYAHWLHHHRAAPAAFTVRVGGRTVACEVSGDSVQVAMGRASFDPAEVPTTLEEVLVDGPLRPSVAMPGEPPLLATALGLGNPHCVMFFERDLDDLPWRRWGKAIEHHPVFPNRTNVQFARVLDRGQIAIRIHERGAGPTLASGSSACGVAAAAVRTGRADRDLRIVAPGGVLNVRVDADWQLHLAGPVEEVGTFRPSPAFEARWTSAATS